MRQLNSGVGVNKRSGAPIKSRYLVAWVNGRTVLEHRFVMEQALGRKLRRDELVHHKNGNKHDNRIENLEVTTAAKHSEHHNQKHPKSFTCAICGAAFVPHKTKRARQKTCSWLCRNALISRTRKVKALLGS